MKIIVTILMSVMTIGVFSQTLKTFNGPFNADKTQSGTAVYTYYEDPETHEYLKQGTFKYTFNGKGDYKGYNQTITGSFEKGLKNGKWTYTIKMTDFGNKNPYYTGTVTLISNYKNGYADGNWKEVRSYKVRKKYYSYGQYKWEPFGSVKTMTINMNFKNGYIVGAVSINDEFANFKATGSYDNNSLAIGTWTINDMGWGQNRELIYKDNFLYEFIARSNSGAVKSGTKKYQDSYDKLLKAKSMSVTEREELGLKIDTVCGGKCAPTSNIQTYFPKLFSINYFLYKYIGGDLSFKEGFKGGCHIQLKTVNYKPLAEIDKYKKAEEFYKNGDLLQAFDNYNKINLKDSGYDIIKPSERKKVKDRISEMSPKVEALIESYHSNSAFFSKYIKSQYDSLVSDFNLLNQEFKIKKITKIKKIKANANVYSNETRDVEVEVQPVSVYSCKCNEPWNEQKASIAMKCFKTNPNFYDPYQKTITEYYFNFVKVLDDEEKAVKKSSLSINFNDTNQSFYTYDKDTFINNINKAKSKYEFAKSKYIKSKIRIDLENNVLNKKSRIEQLNKDNKKKKLFRKYIIVINDMQNNYNSLEILDECIDALNESIILLNKVISLYSTETKEIEKLLKDAETVEQIKAIILK